MLSQVVMTFSCYTRLDKISIAATFLIIAHHASQTTRPTNRPAGGAVESNATQRAAPSKTYRRMITGSRKIRSVEPRRQSSTQASYSTSPKAHHHVHTPYNSAHLNYFKPRIRLVRSRLHAASFWFPASPKLVMNRSLPPLLDHHERRHQPCASNHQFNHS